MKVKSSKRLPNSFSDNPKLAIQNPKWAGLLGVVVAFALYGAAAEAQQPGKSFRIGFIDSSHASGMAVLVDALRQELSKLGWSEGKNITFEYRFAEEKLTACLSLQRNWYVSRSISSSQRLARWC